MENWLKKCECTGCGACYNICPKGAIKMVDDKSGFKYPIINKDLCVDCGLCKKVCPVLEKKDTNKYDKPKAYAAWSKNTENRYKSTSGGLFTEIVTPIIENGGFVVGAAYNRENLVEHKIVNDMSGLEELRQSKYLQSDTLKIYKDTKDILEKGNMVTFCGSPCQIAALYKFLKKDYDNLVTIEFICRGMNSPKAYKAWLSEIEKKENKKVKKVWFKYKINGWKSSPRCTRLDFEDDSYKIYDGEENKFMSGYLGPNLYIRPSCGRCKFNGLPRQADITLADFWGINKELDDDKGTSLVLINSQRGSKCFETIKNNIFVKERTIDEIYDGNVCFNTSVKINKKSEEFLNRLDDTNFSKLVEKYSRVSLLRKAYRRTKNYIRKILRKN